MEGRYIHLVADMSDVSDPTYETSICSYGIMGTRYSRSSSIQPTVEIVQGQTETISVPHISSDFVIGTQLKINLRQYAASPLPFVKLVQLASES